MHEPSAALIAAFSDHSRAFDGFRHVYPVLSRRSGGLSIGVNLNLDKLCNYACPYCQVDRRAPSPRIPADPSAVAAELETMLGLVARTGLADAFPGVAPEDRALRDIALSGDGEPTLESAFPAVCDALAALQARWHAAGGTPFRLVCITNATRLDHPSVLEALRRLCARDGEVWAKLDAGTDSWQERMSGSKIGLERVISNIATAAASVPVRIQSLWMEMDGLAPPDLEVEAWLERVQRIHAKAPLRGVQIHTVARATSRPGCRPLDLRWLQAVAREVEALGIDVDVHGGIDAGSIEAPRLPS